MTSFGFHDVFAGEQLHFPPLFIKKQLKLTKYVLDYFLKNFKILHIHGKRQNTEVNDHGNVPIKLLKRQAGGQTPQFGKLILFENSAVFHIH